MMKPSTTTVLDDGFPVPELLQGVTGKMNNGSKARRHGTFFFRRPPLRFPAFRSSAKTLQSSHDPLFCISWFQHSLDGALKIIE